jgi:hypothetical protein
MEGFWGMGSTVSSYSTAKRLEVGAPGGGQGGRKKKGQDPEAELRRALADRIEDSLTGLLARVEELLTQNRENVLCLAHALESHKTLSGDDVLAVLEHRPGPLVDGRPYGNAAFVQRLEEYHQGAAAAHRSHSKAPLSLPAAPSPCGCRRTRRSRRRRRTSSGPDRRCAPPTGCGLWSTWSTGRPWPASW